MSPRPKLLLVYHFFHPDDVVSARQFTDMALEQHARGWDVTVLTSNRLWSKPDAELPPEERWRGIRIVRVRRPPWRQTNPAERLANSGWLIGAWLARAARLGPVDAVVVGSDPAFAALLLVGLRALWGRRARLVHWCFDVFPDAIEADAMGTAARLLSPGARAVMRLAYRACDEVVDLGPRMRERLEAYGPVARRETLVPWALVEPEEPPPRDPRVFRELFGDAALGLLYSGTLARAHDFESFVALARRCRARSGGRIAFCFACRGARVPELKAALTEDDVNVRIAGFCAEAELEARLAAADLHLISLRPGWSGIVVPSKFFGSIAVAKPVLYAGERESDIARHIEAHDVGLVLDGEGAIDATADALHRIADDPQALAEWQANARRVYHREYSKRAINDRWDALLRRALCAEARAADAAASTASA